jgi:glycosyltransferase involved in cell wall biosynthesis
MTSKISLVIPAYNEEATIPLLRGALVALFDANPSLEFELVLVDDHSSDRTGELVKAWADEDPRIVYLRLSRNSGSHAALYAGLSQCTGDAAAFLAADLQDPPEIVVTMVEHWKGGSDVVWAVRTARPGEKLSVRAFSRIYHFVMKRFVLSNMPASGTDFFLMGRKVMDAYMTIPEKNTDFMNMVLWMGFRQSFIPYVKVARARGESKWTFSKKLKHFVDSVISFSFVPIRTMSIIGAIFAFVGFSYALVVIVGRFFGFVIAGAGFAATMTVLLMGQGFIMLMLGVIGEYVWRTLDEARRRPRFIVEEKYLQARDKEPK